MAQPALMAPQGSSARPAPVAGGRRNAVDVLALDREIKRMESRRATYEPQWRLLGEFFAPSKRMVNLLPAPGVKQTDRLFDSTCVHAVELFASSIHGDMTSPAQKWFGLAWRQQDLNEGKAGRDWLENTADRIYAEYGQSNFTMELLECYIDLIVFGTCCLLQTEKAGSLPGRFAGVSFEAIPMGSYLIEENPEKRVDRLHRQLFMPARSAYRWWGAAIGETLLAIYRERPEEEVEVWHSVYPREVTWPLPMAVGGQKRFASVYWCARSKHAIAEGGFDEFPYAVCRWTKSGREEWGRGPCHTALPDARTLNREVEIYLGASAKAVDPTLLQLHNSVIGQLSLEPAAVNTVTDMNALKPLESASRFDVANMLHERLERKIREVLHIDQIALQETHPMTATETMARIERQMKLLGPAGGRIQYELLGPTIERSAAIMARRRAILPVPPELEGTDAVIDIRYEGPLARAQRAQDLVAIERKNAWVGGAMTHTPEVVDLFDWDAEGRLVSELTGTPADLLADPKLVTQKRGARAQAQAASAKLQSLGGLADAAGKAAPAIKELAPMLKGPAAPPGPGGGPAIPPEPPA